MSVSQHSEFSSMTAAADYSSDQYKLVTQTGDQEVTLNTSAGGRIFGILYNAPESGETAEVLRVNSGVTAKVKLGGTVSRGGAIMSNASSVGVAATSTNNAIGYALEAGVSGDIIQVELEPHVVA